MKLVVTDHKKKIENYPFFNLVIAYDKSGAYISYPFYKTFKSEREAWLFLLEEMLKRCKKIVTEKHRDFTNFDSLIEIHINDWCDNHGKGKYHKTWKEYIWLNGSYLITPRVSNNYALRFSSEHYDRDALTKIGIMLVLRHAHRFIREYETLKKHFDD